MLQSKQMMDNTIMQKILAEKKCLNIKISVEYLHWKVSVGNTFKYIKKAVKRLVGIEVLQ